jgi:hypothetical protein
MTTFRCLLELLQQTICLLHIAWGNVFTQGNPCKQQSANKHTDASLPIRI